ncbi:MAG: RagB/SusD family nutrient uptake outer membrane protein [Bacteroidales bacterium]|nr:RagB/SusD family nutrient uptake outer membrane protein [Bacteroidales bacterium]
MKKIYLLATCLTMALLLCSCDSWFDVTLDDQANMEEIFSKRATTHNYLSHIYSYIPLEEEVVGSDGWVVARSDEALFSFYQWVNYIPYRTGNYSSATPTSALFFNYWEKFYIAIKQCTIFMDNVSLDLDDNETVRTYMKAEARFLRAYYYFCLFRQYGPVFIWGDRDSDETILGSSIDRNTVEENIEFMVSELDKAAVDLPLYVSDTGEGADTWQGRVTKGAALALKARILMTAASPLYNGGGAQGNANYIYKGMTNKDGHYLFPLVYDPEKWKRAAEACEDVLSLNIYALCTNSTEADPLQRAASAYESIFQEPWNSETIWGWWSRTSSAYSYLGGSGAAICVSIPPHIMPYAGFGGIAPSLKLVDSYPMAESGRYPVTGYEGSNDYSRPIVDDKSGYKTDGFTEGYKQPVDASWAPAIKAHNSTIGRDARYYACIVPNGFYWPCQALNKKTTLYNNSECTSRWSAVNDCLRVGFAWRKYYKPNTIFNNTGDYQAVKYVYPAFRLAEIYLSLAEAYNEMEPRNEAKAFENLNKVRNRAGLNNIEDAYPEIHGNQDLLRWCIQKERMVEFGMEAMRHYDATRWMIAKSEYPSANWTLNLSASNYEDSYKRVSTDFVGDPATFSDRDYLFPISSQQLAEMTNMTQNYGF